MVKRRNTVQRQLIFDAIKSLDTHASAEEIYEYVVQAHPNISKATVYRNLNQMVKSGELLNIGDFDGSAHYDHNCRKHYHFMCEDCRRIFDVEDDYFSVTVRFEKIGGFDIMDYRLTFSGLCWTCKAKRKNEIQNSLFF